MPTRRGAAPGVSTRSTAPTRSCLLRATRISRSGRSSPSRRSATRSERAACAASRSARSSAARRSRARPAVCSRAWRAARLRATSRAATRASIDALVIDEADAPAEAAVELVVTQDADARPRVANDASRRSCWRPRAGSRRRWNRPVRPRARDAARGGGVDVVVGSRDRDRAAGPPLPSSASRVRRTTTQSRTRDLVVLAVKADAALETARELREAIGTTPVLSVASELRFTLAACSPRRMRHRSPSGSRQSSTRRCSPACTRSPRRASAGTSRPTRTPSSAETTPTRRRSRSSSPSRLTSGRALDAGPLASARALEGLTAVIVNLNKRYRAHAGHPGHGDLLTASCASSRSSGSRSSRRATISAGCSSRRRLGRWARGGRRRSSSRRRRSRRWRVASSISPGSSRRRGHASSRARRDPRRIEVILRESREIVRARPPLVIAETRHGFVCASAGVDASNAKGPTRSSCFRSIPMPPRERLRDRDSRAAGRRRGRHRLGLLRPRVAARHDGCRARRRGHRRAARPRRASATRRATSSMRPRSRSPTRSPARRSSSWARRRHSGGDRPRARARGRRPRQRSRHAARARPVPLTRLDSCPCARTRSGALRRLPRTRSGCSIGKQFEKDDFVPVDDIAEADFVLNMFDPDDPKAFRRASRGTYSAAFYELPEAPDDALKASYPMLVRTLSNVVLLRVPGEGRVVHHDGAGDVPRVRGPARSTSGSSRSRRRAS